MNRSRMFLAVGVALAIVAFVAVLAFGSPGQEPASQPAASVTVVVAAQDISLGTAVSPEMVTTEGRTAAEAVDGFQSVDSVLGSVARQPITHGQVLRPSDFQTQSVSNSNVVAALRPGLRAIAVPLDEVTAVAYLVQPGDWVDVIIALEDLDGLNPVVATKPVVAGGDGSSDPYALLDQYVNNTSVKVLVQNVQVLATQQANDQDANGNRPTVPAAFLAVLAVNPQDAELIRFAQLDGHVSLVLRSPVDQSAGTVTTNGVTLYELVNKWGVLPARPVVATP